MIYLKLHLVLKQVSLSAKSGCQRWWNEALSQMGLADSKKQTVMEGTPIYLGQKDEKSLGGENESIQKPVYISSLRAVLMTFARDWGGAEQNYKIWVPQSLLCTANILLNSRGFAIGLRVNSLSRKGLRESRSFGLRIKHLNYIIHETNPHCPHTLKIKEMRVGSWLGNRIAMRL